MKVDGRSLLVQVINISKRLVTSDLRIVCQEVSCCYKAFCSVVILQKL